MTLVAVQTGDEIPSKGPSAVRAAVLVPWAMATVVTSKRFGWLLDGQHGVVNGLLRSSRPIADNIDRYGSVDHALGTVMVADVWNTAPVMALLLLDELQTIPEPLLEAARMDGIGPIGLPIRIMLPLSAPALVTVGPVIAPHPALRATFSPRGEG